jgi:hypothetical protein
MTEPGRRFQRSLAHYPNPTTSCAHAPRAATLLRRQAVLMNSRLFNRSNCIRCP